jgi:hypothetical protein
MLVTAVLGLFFGAFAFGSLHTARQEYHWREASIVRGVLVKQGAAFHYEYRPKQQPPVIGAPFHDDSLTGQDGVVDDWVDLEYDARLPEKIRLHDSGHNLRTIYQRFLFTTSVGSVFAVAVAICLWKFLRAWYDKLHANNLN